MIAQVVMPLDILKKLLEGREGLLRDQKGPLEGCKSLSSPEIFGRFTGVLERQDLVPRGQGIALGGSIRKDWDPPRPHWPCKAVRLSSEMQSLPPPLGCYEGMLAPCWGILEGGTVRSGDSDSGWLPEAATFFCKKMFKGLLF